MPEDDQHPAERIGEGVVALPVRRRVGGEVGEERPRSPCPWRSSAAATPATHGRKRRLRGHGQGCCCPARPGCLADPVDRRLRERLHAARRRRSGDADRHGRRLVGQEGDRGAALDGLRPERGHPADADPLPSRPRRRCGVRRQGDRPARSTCTPTTPSTCAPGPSPTATPPRGSASCSAGSPSPRSRAVAVGEELGGRAGGAVRRRHPGRSTRRVTHRATRRTSTRSPAP